MVRFRTAPVVFVLIALTAGSSRAADQLLAGRKLSVSDRAGRQRTTFVAKTPTIVAPTPQSGDDPTVGGATLKIVNPTSGESASLDLPASSWSVNAAKVLYKFKNSSAPSGP